MGRELTCSGRFEGQRSQGKLRLETDHILFRGDFRLKIELKDVRSVSVREDDLVVETKRGTASFEIGPIEAGRWEEAVKHPKSLVDKLGAKPGLRASVLGLSNDGFEQQLIESGVDVSRRKRKGSDMIFVSVEKPRDLARLEGLEDHLARDGSIWTISPKGRKDFNENDIYAAARALDLTDVKVVRFSSSHTANKFVIPKKRR